MKSKNKIVWMVWMVVVLAMVSGSYAERILYVGLEVSRADSVELKYLKLGEGNPTKYIALGNYRLEVLDSSGAILFESPLKLSFMVMSDPPVVKDTAVIGLRVKYDISMEKLNLYKKISEQRPEELIFSSEIKLCDRDGVCDVRKESYLSCPRDCPLNREDGICLKTGDGVCDPDCVTGADPDCKEEIAVELCDMNGVCEPHEGEDRYNCLDCKAVDDMVCRVEGEFITPEDNQSCCEGLVPIEYVSQRDMDPCDLGEVSFYICADCGDGECAVIENLCNCPSDCLNGAVVPPKGGNVSGPKCGNALCEPNFENHMTCPQDCKSGSSDGYCDGVSDGVCDPDCNGGEMDCGLAYLMGYVQYIVLMVVLVGIVLIIYKGYRREDN